MPALISITNRQRTKPLNATLVRRLSRLVFQRLGVRSFDLGLVFVTPETMATINQEFLNHAGSTDVITFDYSGDSPNLGEGHVAGEIVICVDDAVAQATLFRTSWQSEVIRYVAHGILHLLGYDDLEPSARKVMKKAENDMVAWLEQQVDFATL